MHMIESTTVQAGDRLHSPLIKAIFHHSSQVGPGATESTCNCFVQHQNQSQTNYLHQWFNHQGLHPLQPNIIHRAVQVVDLPSILHIQVVQLSGLKSTSNSSEHQRKHTTLGCERRSSHHTNHTSAPVDVVEEISHKSPSLLTGRQQLSQQVGLIFMSADIASPPFVIGHSLTDKMECNAL
jgi:hypothetical protein